jgi:hypothetical protein
LTGHALVQPVTMAAPSVTVYAKPPSESARAPLGAAKLLASIKAIAAERIRLAGIMYSMLPVRDPERQAHTCTIPWREEFWKDLIEKCRSPSMLLKLKSFLHACSSPQKHCQKQHRPHQMVEAV